MDIEQCIIFATRSKNGLVAERLGSGLQNHVHQFESGRDLNENPIRNDWVFLF